MGFLITDLAGTTLAREEREFIQHPALAGIILFTRNYETPWQLAALTADIKSVRDSLLIAADQEGGRVQRFRQGFTEVPAMRHFGELYQRDPVQGKQALERMVQTVVSELQAVGINTNMVPVLDVDQGVSTVIGERSFGGDPALVTTLGRVVVDTLHAHQMPAVAKHFPGHGAVAADSHQTLPVDSRDLQLIESGDLQPFAQLLQSLDAIMPAHVIYEGCDSRPATFSRYWLQQVLRQQLGFTGAIVSDDISMAGAAMVGDHADRAKAALEAGCDLITACNDREGSMAILDALGSYRQPESEARIGALGHL